MKTRWAAKFESLSSFPKISWTYLDIITCLGEFDVLSLVFALLVLHINRLSCVLTVFLWKFNWSLFSKCRVLVNFLFGSSLFISSCSRLCLWATNFNGGNVSRSRIFFCIFSLKWATSSNFVWCFTFRWKIGRAGRETDGQNEFLSFILINHSACMWAVLCSFPDM